MGFADALGGFLARALYTMIMTSANPTHVNAAFAGSAGIHPGVFDAILRR